MDWAAFFNMGGYAFYVWSSWGLSLLGCVVILTLAKVRSATIRKRLMTQLKRQQKYQQ